MEEFKNVTWDILIDDLQIMSREELINTVISKQNDIETLKFEIQTLHHEKQRNYNEKLEEQQSLENIFEQKYQHYLKETVKMQGFIRDLKMKIDAWRDSENLKVQKTIKELQNKRRNDMKRFQGYLKNISKIFNEQLSTQPKSYIKSPVPFKTPQTHLDELRFSNVESEDYYSSNSEILVVETHTQNHQQIEHNPTLLIQTDIDDNYGTHNDLKSQQNTKTPQVFAYTQNLQGYQQHYQKKAENIIRATNEVELLSAQQNIKNILRENLQSQQSMNSKNSQKDSNDNDNNKENMLIISNQAIAIKQNHLQKTHSLEKLKSFNKTSTKAQILIQNSSPGEKMEKCNKIPRIQSAQSQTQQASMLKKVLSPDITPPLSDEELENNQPQIMLTGQSINQVRQSECVRDTYDCRDFERINKPNFIQTFKVKRQTINEYNQNSQSQQKSSKFEGSSETQKHQYNCLDQTVKDLLIALEVAVSQLQKKIDKLKSTQIAYEFIDFDFLRVLEDNLNQTKEQLALDILDDSQVSLTDKEALTQYFFEKHKNGSNQMQLANVKVDDILRVTFIDHNNEQQSQLSCLQNVEFASQLFVQVVDTDETYQQEDNNQAILSDIQNDYDSLSQDKFNDAYQDISQTNMTKQEQNEFKTQEKPQNEAIELNHQSEIDQIYYTRKSNIGIKAPNNLILACSPITYHNEQENMQNQSNNMSYTEELQAIVNNHDKNIEKIKVKLNMNKDFIVLSGLERKGNSHPYLDDQSFMFGETFGNNQSKLLDGDEQNTMIIHEMSPEKLRFRRKQQDSLIQNSPENIKVEDGNQNESYSKSSIVSQSQQSYRPSIDQNHSNFFSNDKNFFSYNKVQKSDLSDLNQNQRFNIQDDAPISLASSQNQQYSQRSNNRYINYESQMEIEDEEDHEIIDVTCIVNPSFQDTDQQFTVDNNFSPQLIKVQQITLEQAEVPQTTIYLKHLRSDSLDHSVIQTENQALGIGQNLISKENINPNFKMQMKAKQIQQNQKQPISEFNGKINRAL
eukprot:403342425